MKKIIVSILGFVWFPIVSANDSFARIGTGGLELTKTDAVQMKSEILEVSPNKIEVTYEFVNTGKVDVNTVVAFPMPIYGWASHENADNANIHPIFNFWTTVDEKKIVTHSNFKALIDGKDVFDNLLRMGLSVAEITGFLGCDVDGELVCKISEARMASLRKAKFVEGLNYPKWQIEQIETWNQTFPAGKSTSVSHSYQPLSGNVSFYPDSNGDDHREKDIDSSLLEKGAEACFDNQFKKAYLKKISLFREQYKKNIVVILDDIEYILGTGRNWAGPIADFTLRIKKQSKDQLVSLCFPGKPKRLEDGTLEFVQKDFLPQDRLIVHFYTFQTD